VNLLVIDGSVAAKWSFKDETLVEEAVALLDRYYRREVRLIVPDLFWSEVGNILWKAVRTGRCTQEAAGINISSLKALNLRTVSSEGVLELAFNIAVRFDRSFYDSIYAALAVESQAHLITADERLANALAAYLPVRWLGALA